jgi:hypothetical protein
MRKVVFSRTDLEVVAQTQPDGKVFLRCGSTDQWWDVTVSTTDISDAHSFLPIRALADWRRRLKKTKHGPQNLHRIALQIQDLDLAALPWESALLAQVQRENGLVVRTSPVFPQVAGFSFTLPLRVLQLNPLMNLPSRVLALFEDHPAPDVSNAIELYQTNWSGPSDPDVPVSWPSVDILQFDFLPALELPRLLSPADPEDPGTLAWFQRNTRRWRTRLVILHAFGPERSRSALRLAHALTARGGPAVLLDSLPAIELPNLYRAFYQNVVDDQPLDAALVSARADLPLDSHSAVVLFAGGGREEALRVADVGLKLMQFADDLRLDRAQPKEELQDVIRVMLPSKTRAAQNAVSVDMQKSLRGFQTNWKGYQFARKAPRGIIPLGQDISRLRAVVRSHVPELQIAVGQSYQAPAVLAEITNDFWTVKPRKILKPATDRYVSASFSRVAEAGSLVLVEQRLARLNLGKTYQLGINIGPQNMRIFTAGATALFEEIFQWTRGKKAWLEVAVTGLDFQVLGDPVRELLLTETGPTDTLYFPVVPQKTGIARLRYCIYYQQKVLQSFRLAAVIGETTLLNARSSDLPMAELLAKTLGVTPAVVGEAGYMSRLEYSVALPQETLKKEFHPSAISIVANDWDAQSVITLKDAESFAVSTSPDLKGYVENVRQVMADVSTIKLSGNRELYAFKNETVRNQGDLATFGSAIKKLAATGWVLYDHILSAANVQQLALSLATPGQSIHVANILRDKVIPWGALYDRRFDENKGEEQGHPVEVAVCPASLPDAKGDLALEECFTSPSCVLHGYPEKECFGPRGARIVPETVACPLHFWGFRHIIELPPQQVAPGGKSRSMPELISVTAKARGFAGSNATLQSEPEHFAAIQEAAKTRPVEWAPTLYNRDKIIDKLKTDLELALIYFYCHARGGPNAGLVDPQLIFQELTQKPGIITPGALTYASPWKRSPLVFLNGCGTTGYSPEALSPFLTKFVDDRCASGLIGTEIPVWEDLAAEMAELFLNSFLDGKPAGTALLEARRALLSKQNPLGLVYTLYASANLRIAVSQPAPPGSPT